MLFPKFCFLTENLQYFIDYATQVSTYSKYRHLQVSHNHILKVHLICGTTMPDAYIPSNTKSFIIIVIVTALYAPCSVKQVLTF